MSMSSQTSSPLKRQLQLTFSVHRSFEAGFGLSGEPLPFQLPTNSFSACRAAFGLELSGLSAALAVSGTTSTPTRVTQARKCCMDGESPKKRRRRNRSLDACAAALVPLQPQHPQGKPVRVLRRAAVVVFTLSTRRAVPAGLPSLLALKPMEDRGLGNTWPPVRPRHTTCILNPGCG